MGSAHDRAMIAAVGWLISIVYRVAIAFCQKPRGARPPWLARALDLLLCVSLLVIGVRVYRYCWRERLAQDRAGASRGA
jgi:hypothetical protein